MEGASNATFVAARLQPLLQQLKQELNRTGLALAIHAEPYHDEVRELGKVYHSVPVYALMVGHSAYCASIYHGLPFRRFWLLDLLISFTACYGGGTIAAFFMLELASWLRDDFILAIFVVCWWIVVYFPMDLGHSTFELLPVKALCKASSVLLKTRTVLFRVDDAMRVFGPTSVVAPLFLGTIAGCGGRIMCDMAGAAFQLAVPSELGHPSWSLRSTFSLALLYAATVHWLPVLPHDVCQTLLITLMVGQCVASDVTGRELDLTRPFASLFHVFTNIPAPVKGGADPLGGARAAKGTNAKAEVKRADPDTAASKEL